MIKFIKKIPYIRFVPIVIIILIIYKFINNVGNFWLTLKQFVGIFSYLIWGIIIAYFLNYLTEFFISHLKIKKIFCIILTYLVFIGIIVLSILIFIPIIWENLGTFLALVPLYIEKVQIFIIKYIGSNDSFIKQYDLITIVENYSTMLIETANEYINLIFSTALDFTTLMIKFVLGTLISFYMLKDKKKIQKGIKRLLYSTLEKDFVEKIFLITNDLHELFTKFILGRIIVSLIVGAICLIAMLILKIPFAPIIGLVIGITNILPYVGPLVGGVSCFLFILLLDPIKALWAGIFFILLQTFDGFFLGPKIVGDQVNVSPLTIVSAITIGGGFFGVVGMFIAVPVFTLSGKFIKGYINKKLKEKELNI
jgi:predicted PurR-regulated permease PerM